MDQQLQNKGDWGSKYGKLLTFKFTHPMRVENLDPSPHTYCIYTYKSVLSRSFGGIVEASNFPRITSLTKPGFLLRYSSWKRDPGRLLRFSQSSLGTVHCHVFHLTSSFLLSNYSCWTLDLIYIYSSVKHSKPKADPLWKRKEWEMSDFGMGSTIPGFEGKNCRTNSMFRGKTCFPVALWNGGPPNLPNSGDFPIASATSCPGERSEQVPQRGLMRHAAKNAPLPRGFANELLGDSFWMAVEPLEWSNNNGRIQ